MGFADLVAQTDNAVRSHLANVSVTYAPEVGDPVTLEDQLFDEQHRVVEPNEIGAGGEIGVESIVPAVWLTVADLPVHPDDDNPTLTINGTDYTVHERRYDGMGTVTLLLHEVG